MIFAYIPAKTSSNTTPYPPLHLFSNLRIGKGLRISKNRKRKKPVIIEKIVFGTHSIVMRNPIISSITILGSSCFPKYFWVCSEIQLDRKKKVMSVSSYSGEGIVEIKK